MNDKENSYSGLIDTLFRLTPTGQLTHAFSSTPQLSGENSLSHLSRVLMHPSSTELVDSLAMGGAIRGGGNLSRLNEFLPSPGQGIKLRRLANPADNIFLRRLPVNKEIYSYTRRKASRPGHTGTTTKHIGREEALNMLGGNEWEYFL